MTMRINDYIRATPGFSRDVRDHERADAEHQFREELEAGGRPDLFDELVSHLARVHISEHQPPGPFGIAVGSRNQWDKGRMPFVFVPLDEVVATFGDPERNPFKIWECREAKREQFIADREDDRRERTAEATAGQRHRQAAFDVNRAVKKWAELKPHTRACITAAAKQQDPALRQLCLDLAIAIERERDQVQPVAIDAFGQSSTNVADQQMAQLYNEFARPLFGRQ
jgi:hypothetical protein